MSAEFGKPLQEVSGLIPDVRPFRFIDNPQIIEAGRIGTADLTDLSTPEFSFIKEYFPGGEIVPGVILTEAMAELLGTTVASNQEDLEDKFGVLRRINEMIFKKAILPSDSIRLEAEVVSFRRGIGTGNVKAYLGEEIACFGSISFGIVNQDEFLKKLQRK